MSPSLLLLAGALAAALPPDFDASLGVRDDQRISTAVHGRITSVDRRVGVPTFYWSASGVHADQFASPEGAARRHLARFASMYRIDPTDVDRFVLLRSHDTGVGAIIETFGAEVDGVPVFRDTVHVAMRQNLDLVSISGYLVPLAVRRDAEVGDFFLSSSTALSVATIDLLGTMFGPDEFEFIEKRGGFEWHRGPNVEGPFGAVFPEPVRVRRVVFALPGRLIPAYHLELVAQRDDGPSSEMFGYVIDAQDGRVLFRRNLTDDADFTYRVYAEPNLPHRPLEGPQGDAWLPHPVGSFSTFSTQVGTASLVTLEHGPISTQDPWLPGDATETNGNNVDAYADLEEPDGLTGNDFRAVVTSSRAFDYVHDITASPGSSITQQQAAIVQLFFINNYLHDLFYDFGFDEAAGNAQALNFGRGGQEDDSLRAEVQDYSGTDNANMSTRADGARPRMQMYVWSARSIATIDIQGPSPSAGLYPAGTAPFGPSDFNVSGVLTIVEDDAGDIRDGCSDYVNAADVAGRIAFIERGVCNFRVKAERAEAAGAIGVVMIDNRFGWVPPDMTNSGQTTMPMVSMTEAFGNQVRAEITSGSTVTVTIAAVGRANKDSALDGVVVAHEWGHYLTNRLIGNASGLSTIQARGMGEGWGDFVGLYMSVTEDDANVPSNAGWTGTFGVGVNSSYRNPYFGIRRVPYSTEFAKNPLTFSMIENGVPIPTTDPISRDWTGSNNEEVHRTGEVWSSMLWDCYAGLLTDPRLSFADAQQRMGRYLVASLKITPNRPTFVEARDAVLAAAYANDIADFETCYRAFARRGMGFGAVAPPRTSTSNGPLVESFAVGNALEVVDAILDDEALYCDRDGVLDAGETGRLRLVLRNVGVAPLVATTARVTNADPRLSFPAGNTMTFNTFAPFDTAEAFVEVALNGSTDIHEVDVELLIEDASLIGSSTVGVAATFRVSSDVSFNSSTTDDVEAPASPWVHSVDASLTRGQECERVEIDASEHRWYCPNVGSPADLYLTSLPFTVSSTGSFTVAFDHRYDIEDTFDGAVLELSNDGGMNWIDIGLSAQPPYGPPLVANTPNPLEGREAWTGNNPSYPALDRVFVDLGNSYAGDTVQIRFRFGTDTAAAGAGWEIDNITLSGIDGLPFPTLVFDSGVCINRAPRADAGENFTVDEGESATLDASGTSDPDNDQLILLWAQLSGPSVTVDATGSFVAPLVAQDTVLSFQLTALDATLAGTSSVTVTVLNSNRPVDVDAGPDQNVEPGAGVTLMGSATDPDGDAFTLRWRQIDGPSVTLSATDVTSPSFEAPVTDVGLVLLFEVTATEREHVTTDTATITIGPSNRPPTITVSANQNVAANVEVAVSATIEDPDGDTLTLTWRQVSGPSIVLADAASPMTTFTSPSPAAEAEVVLEAEVSDGMLTAKATTTITVAKASTDDKPPPLDESGCSCRTQTRSKSSIWAWSLLALLAGRPLSGSRSRRRFVRRDAR